MGLGSSLVRSRLGVQTSSLELGSTLVRSRHGVQTSSLVRNRLGTQSPWGALGNRGSVIVGKGIPLPPDAGRLRYDNQIWKNKANKSGPLQLTFGQIIPELLRIPHTFCQ